MTLWFELLSPSYLWLIDNTTRSYTAIQSDGYQYTAEVPQGLCLSPKLFGQDLLLMLQTSLRFQAIAGADDHVSPAACSGQTHYLDYIFCFRSCGIFHVNKIKWNWITVPVNHAGFVSHIQWEYAVLQAFLKRKKKYRKREKKITDWNECKRTENVFMLAVNRGQPILLR